MMDHTSQRRVYIYIHAPFDHNSLINTVGPSRFPLPHRNHLTLPQYPPRIRLRPTSPRWIIIEQHFPSPRSLQCSFPAGRSGILRLVRPDHGINTNNAVDRADHFGNLVGVFLGTGLRFGFGGVEVGLQARIALKVRGDGGEGGLAWERARDLACGGSQVGEGENGKWGFVSTFEAACKEVGHLGCKL